MTYPAPTDYQACYNPPVYCYRENYNEFISSPLASQLASFITSAPRKDYSRSDIRNKLSSLSTQKLDFLTNHIDRIYFIETAKFSPAVRKKVRLKLMRKHLIIIAMFVTYLALQIFAKISLNRVKNHPLYTVSRHLAIGTLIPTLVDDLKDLLELPRYKSDEIERAVNEAYRNISEDLVSAKRLIRLDQ